MSDNKRIEHYLDLVCSHVKCQAVHRDIRLELVSHIEEIVEQEKSCGAGDEEALATALMCMGDPAPVGTSLNKVHRPRMEWRLLVLLAGFLGAALVTMFSLSGFMGKNGEYLLHNTVFSALLGLALALALFFVDYRRLVRLAPLLLGLWVLGMVMGLHSLFFMQLRVLALASTFLLAVLSGATLKKYRTLKPVDLVVTFGVVFIPTLLLMAVPSLIGAALYLVTALVLLLIIRHEQKGFLFKALGAAVVLLMVVMATLQPYQSARLLTFLNPERDPYGSGYLPLRLITAVQEGGAFGQRDLAAGSAVPEPHTDFVFTYIIYRYGWVTAFALVLLAASLIYQLVNASRAIREPTGRAIAIGITTTFALMFAGSILVSLGKAPTMSVPFPFVSYSRVLLIVQIMAMGLVLGIYRVKDMISYTEDNVGEYKA
jgi:cell division protein FtsW (lipid II flippase)